MGFFDGLKDFLTPDPEIDFQLALREESFNHNYEKAAWLYQKAAERGHYKAMFFLADMYLNGRGVGKDFGRARDLLRVSSKGGYEKATELLSDLKTGKYPVVGEWIE